ncbi:MAG: hypothetical protein LBD03_00400 [Methanobrevibacter sp.]|jgi:hypothetical protein|nr:hypothetical protein [Candidatus Methanovirga procula]
MALICPIKGKPIKTYMPKLNKNKTLSDIKTKSMNNKSISSESMNN